MEPRALLRLILLQLLKQAIVRKRKLTATQGCGAKLFCRQQAVRPPLGPSVTDLPLLALLLAQGSWSLLANSSLWKGLVQPLLTAAGASARGVRRQVGPESPQQGTPSSTSRRRQTPRRSRTTRRRAHRRMSTSYLSTTSFPTARAQRSSSPQSSPSSFSLRSSSWPPAPEMPAVELRESGVLLDLSTARAAHKAPSLIPLALFFKGPSETGTSFDLETARDISSQVASPSTVPRTSVTGDNPHAATTKGSQDWVEAHGCAATDLWCPVAATGCCEGLQTRASEEGASLPRNHSTVYSLPLPPPAHQQPHEHLWHLQSRHQQLELQCQLLQCRDGQKECQHSTTGTQTSELQLPPLTCHTRTDSLLAAEVACRRQDGGSGSDVALQQPVLFPCQQEEATHRLAEETSACTGREGFGQRQPGHKPPACKRHQCDISSQAASSAGACKQRTLAVDFNKQQVTHDARPLPADRVACSSSELPHAGSGWGARTSPQGPQDDATLREDHGGPPDRLVKAVCSGTSSATCQDSASSGSASRQCLAPLPRYKRQSHIDAEHRRRDKISKGVETLQTLIPSLRPTLPGHARHSKAAMFSKTSDHIRRLQSEVERLEEELSRLRQEALSHQAELQQQIQHLQQVQESTPQRSTQSDTQESTLQRSAQSDTQEAARDQAQQMLDSYIRSAVADNWKFGIFEFVVRALYKTYVTMVSGLSGGEFVARVLDWAEKNLTLVNLRPVVVATLRAVGTKTSIVNRPEQLRNEILALTFHTDLSP